MRVVRSRSGQGEILSRMRSADRAAKTDLYGLRPPARRRAEVLPRVRREDVRDQLSTSKAEGGSLKSETSASRLRACARIRLARRLSSQLRDLPFEREQRSLEHRAV